jgi:hypothetical protein
MIEDKEAFEQAVHWFESLPPTKKAQIIDDFGESELLSDEEVASNFAILITEIQNIIGTTEGQEEAVQALTESGMSSGYATALVEKTANESPPPSLVIETLEELSEDEFNWLVESTVDIYLTEVSMEDILDKGIIEDEKEVTNIRNLIGNALMDYLRGEMSLDGMKSIFSEEGLSDERCQYIADYIEENERELSEKLTFRNVQDILFEEIWDIKERQRRTNQLLEELLHEIETISGDSDTPPNQ